MGEAVSMRDDHVAAGTGSQTSEARNVSVSLKEMWEIYIRAVKSTDKSADNAKVCFHQKLRRVQIRAVIIQ